MAACSNRLRSGSFEILNPSSPVPDYHDINDRLAAIREGNIYLPSIYFNNCLSF